MIVEPHHVLSAGGDASLELLVARPSVDLSRWCETWGMTRGWPPGTISDGCSLLWKCNGFPMVSVIVCPFYFGDIACISIFVYYCLSMCLSMCLSLSLSLSLSIFLSVYLSICISVYLSIYHIISYHVISYHIISYHIISYHIISYHSHTYVASYAGTKG